MKDKLIMFTLIIFLLIPFDSAFCEDDLEIFTKKDSVVKATTLNGLEIPFVKLDNPDSYKRPSNRYPILLKYRDDMRIHANVLFDIISLRFRGNIEYLAVKDKIYPMEGVLIDNDNVNGIKPNITPIDEEKGLFTAKLNIGLSCHALILKPINTSDMPK